MSPFFLPWPPTGNRFFFSLTFFTFFFLPFSFSFVFLQVKHCHYQSQASSMPSEEERSTRDTTVFLHLNNHNQKKRNARKTRNRWASTARVLTYNLCFDFSSRRVTLICLYSQKEALGHSHYQIAASHSRFVFPPPRSI